MPLQQYAYICDATFPLVKTLHLHVSFNGDSSPLHVTLPKHWSNNLLLRRKERTHDSYTLASIMKLMLKALSDERAERWPNTIKALRMTRLQAKKEELDRIEQEKLKVDASEAAYKSQQRKQHIERANKILSLPHMKKVLSKAHINNIMQEIRAQISTKQRMQELWQIEDLKWQEIQKQHCETWMEEEKAKSRERKEAVKAVSTAQLRQIEEHRQRQQKELERKELEKEEVRRLAEEEHAYKEYKDQLKRKRIMELKKEMLHVAKEKQARQESEKHRSQELDRQIVEYTVKKDKFVEERKNERASRRALKEKLRDTVIERQRQAMLAAVDKTEACLRKQQAEKEVEEDKKEKIKAERRKQYSEECDRSRKMQVQMKKMLEQELAAEDISESKQAMKQCLQINEEFKEEEMAHFLRNHTFAEYNKKAMIEKMKKEQQDRDLSIEEERHALERMEEDMQEVPLESLRL